MSDRELLDELIAKLREMEEQLSMAQPEATPHSLLAGRIRHLSILARYVRAGLERMKPPDVTPPSAPPINRDRP